MANNPPTTVNNVPPALVAPCPPPPPQPVKWHAMVCQSDIHGGAHAPDDNTATVSTSPANKDAVSSPCVALPLPLLPRYSSPLQKPRSPQATTTTKKDFILGRMRTKSNPLQRLPQPRLCSPIATSNARLTRHLNLFLPTSARTSPTTSATLPQASAHTRPTPQ